MSDKQGIASLLSGDETLKARIYAKLTAATKETELAAHYPDKGDRKRVRRRALIIGALEAIFEHQLAGGDDDISVEGEKTPLAELADAMRDFIHDTERLDNGHSAELVAAPVGRETIDGFKTITASRKTMIIWLAVAHLWKQGISEEFPTQGALLNAAAASLKRTAKSLKTELHEIRNHGVNNAEERKHFKSIVSFAESLAVDGDPRKSAFNLLLPIARAISSDQILKPASASKS
ncbi:hypothetical protein [Yoonia sp.]|uniref:hypothetical protein n=1 Tax=Yoonia sp. TaxID=2212373 RepID=UPI004047F450